MKIDGPNQPPFMKGGPALAGADGKGAAFTAAMASASASTTTEPRRTDFTHMSRDQLFNWMNEKIRSGELSMDDSSGLLALSSTLAVDPAMTGANGGEPVNFFAMAEQGIVNARQRRDDGAEAMMQTALDILRRHQSPLNRSA